jgi:hypothetical protein
MDGMIVRIRPGARVVYGTLSTERSQKGVLHALPTCAVYKGGKADTQPSWLVDAIVSAANHDPMARRYAHKHLCWKCCVKVVKVP